MTPASALRDLQASHPEILCVAEKSHYLHDPS